ncbi:ABC transporter substrate-binding protein [Variovorax sp. LT1P1]|uniref:ABC transporter substrate-binding protein n=1 Tax=Variovorax sp. LT1P1 TaxID=3443730 RepID=UPI003F4556F0
MLIHAVNRGASLKVIGTGQSAPNFFLVATPDLKKASGGVGYPEVMQYFKGKKVGVTARGSAAEFQMISMLKGAGMKATDAVIVAVGSPDTALPAISQKQVDGLMTFAPLEGFCEVTKACSMVVDPRKGQGPAEIVDLSGAAIVSVVRADFAQKNPQTIHAFRRAMSEAEDFVQNPANFAAIMKVAQDTFKINGPDGDKVLEVSLRNTLPGYKFGLNPKAFQYSAEYMHRTGQIDKVIDTSKLLLIR